MSQHYLEQFLTLSFISKSNMVTKFLVITEDISRFHTVELNRQTR